MEIETNNVDNLPVFLMLGSILRNGFICFSLVARRKALPLAIVQMGVNFGAGKRRQTLADCRLVQP